MSGSTMSEHALRQAWRQADLGVARSLAALCYGGASGARELEHLSHTAAVATRQRCELAACLAVLSSVQAKPAQEVPSQPAMQILQAAGGQTKALRPPVEQPLLSLLRQRLSAV